MSDLIYFIGYFVYFDGLNKICSWLTLLAPTYVKLFLKQNFTTKLTNNFI